MAVNPDLLLVVESSTIGDGEADLGETLMEAFLAQLVASGTTPAKAIFMSTGVMLTTRGSPVAKELLALELGGCEISSCGTCLDYYGRADKLVVGNRGTMKETVRALLDFTKILRP